MYKENSIGCVAVCYAGKYGIIEKYSKKTGLYKGRCIWPKEKFGRKWQSKNPTIFFKINYMPTFNCPINPEPFNYYNVSG